METIVVKILGKKGDYHNKDAVDKVVKYILKDSKRNPNGDNIYGCIGFFGKSKDEIIQDFHKVKRLYHKEDGLQIRHMQLSFSKRPEFDRRKIHKLIKRMVGFFGKDYQLVYAVHENTMEDDTKKWHIHIGINSVSIDGKKINIRGKDNHKFNKHLRNIWKGYDLAYYDKNTDSASD